MRGGRAIALLLPGLVALAAGPAAFAQEGAVAPDADPAGPGWYARLIWLVYSHAWVSWIYFGLLLWMLIYCLRHDPERSLWIWVLLVFQPLGPVLYFFVRWLPSTRLQPPKFLARWLRGREINRLRIAASQIGNAHQHVELGEALRDIGRPGDARDAYAAALAKDPTHLGALWGAANVEFQQKNFAAARDRLSQILARDAAYKFGDVSLLYARTLAALQDLPGARAHLEQHTRRWRHPEALYMLACLQADAGETTSARALLQGVIMDVDASPRSIARKFYFWKGRARRMLRKLPEPPAARSP